MKNQNKTRFEVGMPVIYINNGQVIEACIQSISSKWYIKDVHFPIVIRWDNESLDYTTENFDINGYNDVGDTFPSLFALPEYEALKALTDSFVDGTFESGKEQPKFEPQKGEPVLYKGTKCHIEGMQNWYILKYPNGFESVRFVSPVEGYQYANGFCIPLKEQPDTEQPETTDLLDRNGQPVYFTEGMEVFDICFGRMGVVKPNIVGNSDVYVDWQDYGSDSYTFDGRMSSSHNQTLFLVSQFEQVQLPKLKPIQVAKPKADVIGLPSWFKGGVKMPYESVLEWISGINEKVKDIFEIFINMSEAKSANECIFYSCRYETDTDQSIYFSFVAENRLYSGFIHVDEIAKDSLLVEYVKKGEKVSKRLY